MRSPYTPLATTSARPPGGTSEPTIASTAAVPEPVSSTAVSACLVRRVHAHERIAHLGLERGVFGLAMAEVRRVERTAHARRDRHRPRVHQQRHAVDHARGLDPFREPPCHLVGAQRGARELAVATRLRVHVQEGGASDLLAQRRLERSGVRDPAHRGVAAAPPRQRRDRSRRTRWTGRRSNRARRCRAARARGSAAPRTRSSPAHPSASAVRRRRRSRRSGGPGVRARDRDPDSRRSPSSRPCRAGSAGRPGGRARDP